MWYFSNFGDFYLEVQGVLQKIYPKVFVSLLDFVIIYLKVHTDGDKFPGTWMQVCCRVKHKRNLYDRKFSNVWFVFLNESLLWPLSRSPLSVIVDTYIYSTIIRKLIFYSKDMFRNLNVLKSGYKISSFSLLNFTYVSERREYR